MFTEGQEMHVSAEIGIENFVVRVCCCCYCCYASSVLVISNSFSKKKKNNMNSESLSIAYDYYHAI